MQEFEQEWQPTETEQSGYQAGYMGSYQVEQQKLHPYQEPRQGYVLHIIVIILSSTGFFFSILGIVASGLVLQGASNIGGLPNYLALLQAGGGMGLAISILMMLIFVGLFVPAVIFLSRSVAIRRRYRHFSRHEERMDVK